MGDLLKFGRRKKMPWDGVAGITPRKTPRFLIKIISGALVGIVIGTAIAVLPLSDIVREIGNLVPLASVNESSRVTFGLCHTGGGTNCVVDGDTFWMDGQRVRMADIDAPETHPPKCVREDELGSRATLRLQQILNEGPVQLQVIDRDRDKYDRLLRIVTRNGQSLGMILVQEGLARRWTGSRQPWC